MMEKRLAAQVSRIQRFSVDDGPGIRTTVFFKGCNLICKWCHNPECIGLYETNNSPLSVSVEMTSGQLLDKILRDKTFYKSSGGGVTLSGGEPLLRPEFILAFVTDCKRHGLHVAVDTAGSLSYEILEEAAKAVDLMLYDIKAVTAGVHKEATSSENTDILSNIEKLNTLHVRLWVRVPVIPGINTDKEMEKIAAFLKPLQNIERIELLPYHRYGINKYKQLGIEYQLADLCEPDEEMLKRQYAFFKDARQMVLLS
jgi:pyruvate formate lyase activating enzyme